MTNSGEADILGLGLASSPGYLATSPGYPVLDNATLVGNMSSTLEPKNWTDADIEQLLTDKLGQRYRSEAESISLTLAYCIIFVTGVVGNISTCIVIIKNSYMHTATNYYLFSLAISDMLTLILGLPPELYTIWEAYPWRFGEPYCLFKVFLTEMTSCASILTITAFTVERYVAICHPIRAQTMSSLSRAIKIIVVIWIAACTTAVPYPVHTRTFIYIHHPVSGEPIYESYICTIPHQYVQPMTYMFQFSSFVLFVLPMSLITSLYIRIGLTLRRSSLARQTSDASGSPPHSKSRRSILKMLGQPIRCTASTGSRRRRKQEVVHAYLVAVVVAFFICWAPFHAQRLMTSYIEGDKWTTTLLEIQSQLFYISGVLFFVSSTVNPILYNLMSRKYRQAFKETLCSCCVQQSARVVYRDGRSMYVMDRSATCVTYSGSRTNRWVSDRAPQAGGKGSRVLRQSSRSSDEERPLNSSSHRAACSATGEGGKRKKAARWADKLLQRRQKPTPAHAKDIEININGRARAVGSNGSVFSNGSGSASSSPTVMADHLQDEMEMSQIHSNS